MNFNWKIAFACIAGALLIVLIYGLVSSDNEEEREEVNFWAVGLSMMIWGAESTDEHINRLSDNLDEVVMRELRLCPDMEVVRTFLADASEEKLQAWNSILKPVAERLQEQRKQSDGEWCVFNEALG